MERWALVELTRRDHLALYEHHEALIDALQYVLDRMDEMLNEGKAHDDGDGDGD